MLRQAFKIFTALILFGTLTIMFQATVLAACPDTVPPEGYSVTCNVTGTPGSQKLVFGFNPGVDKTGPGCDGPTGFCLLQPGQTTNCDKGLTTGTNAVCNTQGTQSGPGEWMLVNQNGEIIVSLYTPLSRLPNNGRGLHCIPGAGCSNTTLTACEAAGTSGNKSQWAGYQMDCDDTNKGYKYKMLYESRDGIENMNPWRSPYQALANCECPKGTDGKVSCNAECVNNTDCDTGNCYDTGGGVKRCRNAEARCANNIDCSCGLAVNGGWCWVPTECGASCQQTRGNCGCPPPKDGGTTCDSSTPTIRSCTGGGCSTGGGPGGDPGDGGDPYEPYPYEGGSSSPANYRNYCAGDDWYKGDPHPLAILCVVVRLLNILVLSAGAVFVMIVLISAIKYAMAQGDPKAMQGSKQTLTVAVIGMLVIIGVFAILTILRTVLGLKSDLLNNPFDELSKNLSDLLNTLQIR